MFASRYPDDPLSLPFGFNTLMQKQVLFCLKELCPNAAKSILYKAVGYVLESAPDEWILARKSLLDSTYGFTAILKEHDFWEMADKETQKRIVALLEKLFQQERVSARPIGRNTQNVIYVPAAVEGIQGHHADVVVTDETVAPPIETLHTMAEGTFLDEDQVRYFVGQVKATLGIDHLDEDLLRQNVFQAVAEVQAQNPHMVNGVVPAVVHRAADLYREHVLRQYGTP